MMRKHQALALAALGSALIPVSAMAQDIAPETRAVVTPMAPPATVVTQTGPNTFRVTAIPGVSVAVPVRIQRFSDYDLNSDGYYSASEFGQALYFLASGDPVLGNPALPRTDRTMHKGAPQPLDPRIAVALLNVTSDEFAVVDTNNDIRISPTELAAASLM